MARETRNEQIARRNQEAITSMENSAIAYPRLFLETMSSAIAENFELVYVDTTDGSFTFIDSDHDDDSITYTIFNDFVSGGYNKDYLNDFRMAINRKIELRLENNRKKLLQKAAFAKLNNLFTVEERELLGL